MRLPFLFFYYTVSRRNRFFISEWHSYGKMECEITAQLWMDYGVMLILRVISRIDSLHTHVETQYKIVEV